MSAEYTIKGSQTASIPGNVSRKFFGVMPVGEEVENLPTSVAFKACRTKLEVMTSEAYVKLASTLVDRHKLRKLVILASVDSGTVACCRKTLKSKGSAVPEARC